MPSTLLSNASTVLFSCLNSGLPLKFAHSQLNEAASISIQQEPQNTHLKVEIWEIALAQQKCQWMTVFVKWQNNHPPLIFNCIKKKSSPHHPHLCPHQKLNWAIYNGHRSLSKSRYPALNDSSCYPRDIFMNLNNIQYTAALITGAPVSTLHIHFLHDLQKSTHLI